MNIIESLKWRYATKKFDENKELPIEKLQILKQAFNLTATSFGLQTIKMMVIKDKEVREKLVPFSFNQRQVADASHLLVICVNDDIISNDVDDHFDNVSQIRNTPQPILEPYRNDLKIIMKEMSQEQRQDWSIKQAFIALGNLMTVCAIERIDSCPMEGFIAEKYDEILGLKELKLKSILLLPVGYRDKNDMFANLKKVRKPLDDAIIEF